MKIVIFGGTFDPVHREHVNIVKAAAEQFRPDRFLVMPAKLPPHKRPEGVSSPGQRAEMARIAFGAIPGVEVSDFEYRLPGKSYTADTLEALHRENPEAELVLLIGGDSLRDFFSWRDPKRILSLARIAVARRRGAGSFAAAQKRFQRRAGYLPEEVAYTGKNISSTELKVLLLYGIDVSDRIPREVLEYIRKNGLYRERQAFVKKTAEYLTEKRYRHTAHTVAEAMILARRAGADPEKTFLATALHDVAKKMKAEDLAAIGFAADPTMPEPVVHAFAGAYVAEKCFGIRDPEILDAIRYHTTGRPAMTQLEKVVYTADCIEKTRVYDGVNGLRRAVEANFERGFVACLKGTMELLTTAGRDQVSALTAQAYEYYKERKTGGRKRKGTGNRRGNPVEKRV